LYAGRKHGIGIAAAECGRDQVEGAGSQ
jgi:hypothetical protein